MLLVSVIKYFKFPPTELYCACCCFLEYMDTYMQTQGFREIMTNDIQFNKSACCLL